MFLSGNKKPDVTIFIHSMSGGGAEHVVATLCNEFVKRGKSVKLLLVQKTGPHIQSLSKDVVLHSFDKSRLYKTFLPLVWYLFINRPKTLLCFLSGVNAIGILANLLAGVPSKVFVSERAVYSSVIANTKLSGIRRALLLVIPCLYHLASGLICVSNDVAEDLKRFVRLPKRKVVVIHNPSVKDDLIAIKRKKQPLHRWLVNKKQPVIIAVGRLNTIKNYPLLLDAFKEVRIHINARLIIVGNGEERDFLQQKIQSLGLSRHVAMPGYVSNVKDHVSKADCFVMCSKSEGMPNALIEALAYGCPVVATNSPGGIKDVLDNGKYGLLPAPDNKQELADAILKVLKHPKAAKKRTMLFQKEKMREFTPEYIVPQYLAALGF